VTAEPVVDDLDFSFDPIRDAMAIEVRKMKPEQRAALTRLARPRIVEPYTKHIPHPAQQVFLSLMDKEVMYGGAAGGGKSDALLMAALQFVDVPGYSALILRRTWPDLNAPGAILDRARTWFADTDAQQKDGGRVWEFPTRQLDGQPSQSARIQFGYLLHDKDKHKFQSAEYQFIGFDELTHFEDTIYHYMFSRIRRPSVSCLNCRTSIRSYRDKAGNLYWKHTNAEGKKCKETFPDPKVLVQYPEGSTGMSIFDVPLRMRSATNPGGVGHVWVKERFIDSATRDPNSYFVRARLSDNPSLDQETYRENLAHLLPVDRERLLNGDWDVEEEGAMFARHDFEVIDEAPVGGDVVRFWDMAATLDGDYTVGAKVRHFDGQWFIEDINRFRLKPHDVEKMIRQTAMLDGQYLPIRMEQEPGSAGVNNISHYRRNILPGFNFDGTRSTGDKIQRAYPVASAAQAGNVFLVKGAWNKDFIEEAALFPNGANDDQVDAVAGAVAELAFGRRSRLIV
jgi:predicted phage terminase large subunit-like protein